MSPASTVSAPVAAMSLGLVRRHAARDVGIFDTERAAEAAADLRRRELGQLQSVDGGEQAARLRPDPELAQAGARVVIGHRPVVARLHRLDAALVDQERHQLEGARGEAAGAGLPFRIAGEERRVVALDHAGAGAGRRHRRIERLERGDDVAGDRLRIGAVAAVVGGLAAAGLGGRHDHLAAGALQQRRGGEAHRRPEQIDEAGHEEADPAGRCGHGRLVSVGKGSRD